MYNRSCLLGFGNMLFLVGAFYATCSYWIYTHSHYHAELFSVMAALLSILTIAFGVKMVVMYRHVKHL